MTPPPLFPTHIPPVDSSSPQAWADSIIRRHKAVIANGFGLSGDGTPYDLDRYLDDMVGDVPWDEDQYRAVYQAFIAHPEYEATVKVFKDKYGVDGGLYDPDDDLTDHRGRL